MIIIFEVFSENGIYKNKNEEILKKNFNKIKKDLIKIKKIFSKNQEVLINNFYNFNLNYQNQNLEQKILDLNNFLGNKFKNNFKIIDLKSLILKLGLKESIDYSKFISSKILYSNQLVENYLAKIGYILNKTLYKKSNCIGW